MTYIPTYIHTYNTLHTYVLVKLKDFIIILSFPGTVPESGTLFPHGNNKVARPHIRTAPSVIKEAGQARTDPSLHYKEKIAERKIPLTLCMVHNLQYAVITNTLHLSCTQQWLHCMYRHTQH